VVDTHKTLLVLLVKIFGGLVPPLCGFGILLAIRCLSLAHIYFIGGIFVGL
jgi:hypothetical protein